MLNIFRRKARDFFTPEEKERIQAAIAEAETRTSGEVRIFIESKCRYVDPLDRAAEVFFQMKMDQTRDRNASLIYIAVKDHQAAILGDEGIHQKVGTDYWNEEIRKMLMHFKNHHLADGIIEVIKDIGDALHQHFPYDQDTDKNELPDEIVFGS